MELIFGITRLMLGLLISLYAFKILTPKENGIIRKHLSLFKILAIFLILSGIFSLVTYEYY